MPHKGRNCFFYTQEHTTGLNCERCLDGFYRPRGFSPTASSPCRPCACRETFTSTSLCVPDSSREDEGLVSLLKPAGERDVKFLDYLLYQGLVNLCIACLSAL